MRGDDTCPCGSGDPFGGCCLPLHTGERQADTAEELMRSRYSAYAVGDLDYVWRTWHPGTRPAELSPVPGLEWVGLEVVDVDVDVVEYLAHFRQSRRSGTGAREEHTGVLHERSRFAVRARRWFYVDGELFE